MENLRLGSVVRVLEDLKKLEIELKEQFEENKKNGYDDFATDSQEEWLRVKKAINALEDR